MVISDNITVSRIDNARAFAGTLGRTAEKAFNPCLGADADTTVGSFGINRLNY